MSNELVRLDLASLKQLGDGRVAIAFDQAMRRVALDCQDRPGEKRPRKVLLEVQVIPELDDNGECDEVKCEFVVKDAIPTRRSKKYSLGLHRNGQFSFRDGSPENVDQTTLDFNPPDGKSKAAGN